MPKISLRRIWGEKSGGLLGVAVRLGILVIAAAVAVLFTVRWDSWVGGHVDQTTDDAYVKGDLTPLLKAQLSWIIARQDRAWYAVGHARRQLKQLGWSDAQIYELDGSWENFTPAQRALFKVARNLAASPIVLSDDEVASALKLAGPRDVVQVISYTTSRSCFNRITEAAALQLEK